MSVITHSVQNTESNEDLLNGIRATHVYWYTAHTVRMEHNMKYAICAVPCISIKQALLPAPDMAAAVGSEVRSDIFRQLMQL